MEALPHLTEIAALLLERTAKAKAKDPALWPGIHKTIARLEAINVLMADALEGGGDGQTNGQDAGG